MPARYAIRRYPDLVSFWREYQSTLRRGAMLLPADALDDEPAPELKVDLVLPGVGRVGPIDAQVVNRMPGGAVALRVQTLPEGVTAAVAQVQGLLDGLRGWLVETRQLVPPPAKPESAWAEEVEGLRARVAALEADLAQAQAAVDQAQAVRDELARRLASDPGTAPKVVADAAEAVGAPVGDAPTGARPVAPRPPARGRGFPVPDLSRVAPRFEGSMADNSLRQAFMTLAVEKANGLLTIRYPDGLVRYGFWQKGGPVGWRSDPVQEGEVMGVLLFRANQLSKEQLAESLEVMEKRNCRQGDALIELGLLTFAQLVLVLQKQSDYILQRVLADRAGTWTFHALDEHEERFIPPPARVAALLFRNLRAQTREMPAEELAGALRPHLDRYVYLVPGVERTIEEMRLSNDEQGFVKILSQTSFRLRELSSVSNLSRSQTASMVWCLMDLNLIEFRGEEARERIHERISRDLLSRKSTAQKGTLFDRLELHWICTTADVEAAWARLRPQYGPEVVNRYGEEWRPTMELIAQKMTEAYERLRLEGSRREYRAEVMEKNMIEQSALMLAGKGDMAFMKEAGREALDCYTKAVELQPTRPEYQQGLAKARGMVGGS